MKYLLLIFTIYPVLLYAQDKPISDSFEEISQYIYKRRKDYAASGSYIITTKNQEVIYKSMNGMANVEHQVPVTDTTIFDLASIAKMFTGYAIATLEEEKLLSTGDDIRTYLPEFPDYGHKITVGHLVHHTSGIKNWTSLLRTMKWQFHDQITFDQLIRLIYAQTELNFTPGEKYQYSNSGYNLLVKIIEKVTGESFVNWTQHHIFKSLKMENTFFNNEQNRIIPNLAQGYFLNNIGEDVRDFNKTTALGSSSLFSNGDDMAKWMNFLMHPPKGKEKIIERMFTTQKLNNGKENNYAYGIEIEEYKGIKMIHHDGSWVSQNTHLVLLPEQDIAIFVAHNFRTNTRAVINLYIDPLLENPSNDLEYFPKAENNEIQLENKLLDTYIGTYQLGKAWFITISREGNQLLSTANGESAVSMEPINDSTFLVPRYGYRNITFLKNKKGDITGLDYNDMTCPKLNIVDYQDKEEYKVYNGIYYNKELELLFDVTQGKDGFYAKSIKHGNIKLISIYEDAFLGDGIIRSLVFNRDSNDEITGFSITNSKGEKGLSFTKAER